MRCLGVRYLPFRLLPAYTNLYIVCLFVFFPELTVVL